MHAAGEQVRVIIGSRPFWDRLEKLVTLLLPFTKVVMAIQSRAAILADVFRYFIFLGFELMRLSDELPHAFAQHCIKMYSLRGTVQPICHLALFLHPQFKHIFTAAGAYTANILKPACELLKKLRLGSVANMEALVSECALYRGSKAPYDQPFIAGMSVSAWWQEVHGATSPYLVRIAILLAAICPHAADVERLFSIMGNLHTPRRANLSSSSLEMMSKLKTFYGSAPPKVKQPAADVDPDKMPSLPLPEDRPEVLFQQTADADADADEEVQNALQAFCDDGLKEMVMAEAEAVDQAKKQGKSVADQQRARFSSSSLEINNVYPLEEGSCKAAFSPEAPPPAPAAEQAAEMPYRGPDVKVDSFLNDAMLDASMQL